MFPEIEVKMNINEIEDIFEPDIVKTDIGRTPLYDFEKKEYVTKDGKIVECNQDEAIRQWVAFLILTKANKYKVYKDTDFGTDIENYIGYKGNNYGFVVSEIEREITEKAEMNSAIDYVDTFDFERTATGIKVSLIVHKKDGTEMEVDMNVEG